MMSGLSLSIVSTKMSLRAAQLLGPSSAAPKRTLNVATRIPVVVNHLRGECLVYPWDTHLSGARPRSCPRRPS